MSATGEKNRPPTARRVAEARQQGQVAQTATIPHLMAAVGTFELLAMTSGHWLGEVPLLLGSFIEQLGQTNPATKLDVKDLLLPLGGLGLGVILAALLFAAFLALVGNVMQTGFMVAPEAVARLDRLDPFQHAKALFTREQLLVLLMNALKVMAIAACTGAGILMSIDSLLHMADGTLVQAAQAVLDMCVLCERITVLVLLLFVTVDWVIRRQSLMKSLSMSYEEVEAEFKDHFGDKHVRRQRNEFRRDLLAGELTETTRKANAVVTNPTHFAVALFYNPRVYPLPVVLARGADAKAEVIRNVARDNGIPVIRSAQLARMLYSVGLEWNPVPRVALKAVAAVYSVVAEIKAGERSIDDVPDLSEKELGRAERTPPGALDS